MIDIGTTDFLISVPSLPRSEFERYSTRLFDEWDRRVEQILLLPDYSIALEIEEGSVKGIGRIGVILSALYIGIGTYGSFVSGLKTIRGQVSSVSEALVEQAGLPFGNDPNLVKAKKRGGALSRLQKLFDKVQKGEMTSKQAMHEAEDILGDDSESSPEFMRGLYSALDNAPRFPQQIHLPYESLEGVDGALLVDKSRTSRPSHPKPAPPSQQYRVEIWRDSKKLKKNVRLTKLGQKKRRTP